MSGTSMAARHVAGIAALYLAATPTATPATVGSAIGSGGTVDVVSDVAGFPNRLLYSRLVPADAPTATAPASPAAPTASGAKRAVTVAWTAVADGGSALTGYNVRVHRASDGVVAKSATVSGSTLKTTVNGLNGGTAYYATVQAANAVGASLWSPRSNTVTAKR